MRSLMMFLHLLGLSTISAFCPPTSSRLPAPFFRQQWRTNRRPTMTINQGNSNSDATTNNVSVNGAGAAGASDVSSVGGLVTASDAKSQLFSAFTALDLPDQYDAVLTGLCAKILDNDVPVQSGDASGTDTAKALQDPMQLLQEMNEKKIVASPRSIMALIDVRAAALCRLFIEMVGLTFVSDLFLFLFCYLRSLRSKPKTLN
jgi:hypothetical protein